MSLTLLLVHIGSLCQAQAVLTASEAASWIEARVQQDFERSPGNLGRSPWNSDFHFVFLFNSAAVENKSAYAEFSKNMILRFLRARAKDSDRNHRVSFYPYQLGLYVAPRQAVINLPLSPDGITEVEARFPGARFTTEPDGVTPYPPRGGHKNVAARRMLLEKLGPPLQDVPIVVIQITDISLSENPGGQSDPAVRREGGRLEQLGGTGYRAFDVDGQPFTLTPNQQVHVWLYGPEEFPSSKKDPAYLILALLGALAVGVGAYLVYRRISGGLSAGGKQVSIKVDDLGTAVLLPGERAQVVGTGFKIEDQSLQHLLLNGAPPALLFEIIGGKGRVQLRGGFLKVEAADVVNPTLEPGQHKITVSREQFAKRLTLDVQ